MEMQTSAPDSSAEAAVAQAHLVVNATSLGMKRSDPSPIPGEWMHPGLTVCDMVYSFPDTALIKAAEAAGAKAIGGLGMLVAQGALAIDIWADNSQVRASRPVMRAAAEAALERLAAERGDEE